MAHKIWSVSISSWLDYSDSVPLGSLPIRATYLIESNYKNGIASIKRKALKLAIEDGLLEPHIVGMEWINPPSNLRPA